MAEKAENTRSTKGKAPRTNVPWVAAGYDDEATLVALRSAYPLAKWKKIRELFNRRVPEKRRRTLEAIYSKAKLICSAYNPTTQRTAFPVANCSSITGSKDVFLLSQCIKRILTFERPRSFPQRHQPLIWKFSLLAGMALSIPRDALPLSCARWKRWRWRG